VCSRCERADSDFVHRSGKGIKRLQKRREAFLELRPFIGKTK